MAEAPAAHDDYCPYPGPDAPFIPDTWKITLTLLIAVVTIGLFFKWYTRQRLMYFFWESFYSRAVPFGLDTEKAPSYLSSFVYKRVQKRVPNPPQHLISSAPSNCPGILTVTEKCRRGCNNGKDCKEEGDKCKHCNGSTDCKNHCIVTSDDFPILPDQPRIFRTVDGFGNCPYSPHIGQAAQPYSFLLVNKKPPEVDLGGNVVERKLPDVEKIFDTLLRREKDTFEQNDAGLNCLILDFAMLLTHDLFNSRNGYNKNSSYADLSPLYGNDAQSARHVRLFHKGLLDLKKVPTSRAAKLEESIQNTLVKHEDVRKNGEDSGPYTAENAALHKLTKDSQKYNWDWGFAGWRALVELFGREHNHVAEMLRREYPDRFPYKASEDLPKDISEDARKEHEKRNTATDEALFQTARYITTRIYGNVVLTDYACNFLGLKQMNDFFLGRPNRLGNSCSYEFGLLYHWHCLLPDDSSGAEEKKGVPCLPSDGTFKQRGPLDGDYYDCLGGPPNERTFEALLHKEKKQRDDAADRIDDDSPLETVVDLEGLLLTRYKTRIGRFGAFHTPEYMKKAEMRTMRTARQLGAGSYNDFREHLGLMRCKTYEEINPDKKVANALRQLYKADSSGRDHVDDVELYPGIFAERSGVNGIKFGTTLSLGLLEDALNLIRNDRLLVDFDPNTATPKGYQHAVTSHLADVIERNTNLRLVKQQEGPHRLVEYKSTYKNLLDWRHWRLASCALMTVPGTVGTAKKLVFGSEGIQPAELKLYVDPDAFEMGRRAGFNQAKRGQHTRSLHLHGDANGLKSRAKEGLIPALKAAKIEPQDSPTSVLPDGAF